MGSRALKGQKVEAKRKTLAVVADVKVTRKTWLQEQQDPPQLELVLSSGRAIRVQWSLDYATRMLFVVEGDVSTACTGEETGLDDATLDGFVSEVYEAVQQHEAERLADSEGPTLRESMGWL